MNETVQTMSIAGTTSMMEGWTTFHLIMIALFAAVVIAGIWWGMRAKAERRASQRALEARHAVTTVDQVAPEPTAMAPERAAATPLVTPASPSIAPTPPPVAPAPPPIADAPVVATSPTEIDAAPAATFDQLTRLKGLGSKVAARLDELGIARLDQIAALTPDEADALDAQLGTFQGRMARDRWIEQARFLSNGDIAGYEAEFGKLG